MTGSVTTTDDGVELGASGSDTTDAQGKAEFCYTSELPGENVITAYADMNGSGTQDPGEPADIASKTYVVPVTSPLCDVSIHDGGWIVTLTGDRGTFGGNAKTDSGGRVVSGSQEYTDHGPAGSLNAKSTQILAVVCEGNHATVFGTGRVEAAPPYAAGTQAFRVRVMDSGEPGRADTYSILLSNGYWSGDERPLQGGNVQVRTG